MASQSCVRCGGTPPSTDTSHTLIGNHGWRLARVDLPDGRTAREWYCAACWKAHKVSSPPPATTHAADTPSERPSTVFRAATHLLSKIAGKPTKPR